VHGPSEERQRSPPPWGPGFLGVDSWIYRLEYALAFVAILGILIVWPWLLLKDLPAGSIVLAVFWFLWPDLGAFLPIGLATGKGREWPRWGPSLYNALHTWITFGAVFVVWSVVVGSIEWPVLGWAAHIALDRASGFSLRAAAAPHSGSPSK
jgi:hypothetical protein